MRVELEQMLACGCVTFPAGQDVRVVDAAGALVPGVQVVDTETGHGEGLLLDEAGNASVDPQKPDDLLRATWEGLVVHCRHGRL